MKVLKRYPQVFGKKQVYQISAKSNFWALQDAPKYLGQPDTQTLSDSILHHITVPLSRYDPELSSSDLEVQFTQLYHCDGV